MTELQPGDLIADRFRVEALLGEGGIARVYKVRHVRLGSVHALKQLTLVRPALADRLLLEGRIQAQLNHPNLVRVTDVVEHQGQPCLVLEYVPGTHLQALLHDEGPLPLDEGLRLFASVLSAVATAHDVGVLHRDLKPANILLMRAGDRWAPKVSDFGIAKIASGGLRDGETKAGVQMGTPGYMAPEQIEDSAQVDHRADIFALGAILYELLSGQRPFQEDTTFRTLRATIEGRLVPLQERVPGCPANIAEAVHRCLQVEMEDRYQDCHDLADALLHDRPELRALVQRLEAAAIPDGLHRPEITASGPSPASITPASRGEAVADPGLTLSPDDEPQAAAGRAAAGLAASAPSPSAPVDLVAGFSPATDSGAGPSLAGALSPAAAGAEGPSGPRIALGEREASTLGGDEGDLPDEDEPPRRRASPLPWLGLGAAVVVGLVALGWVLSRDPGGGVPTEELDVAPIAGEPVATESEGGAPGAAAPEPAPSEPAPSEPAPSEPGPSEPAAPAGARPAEAPPAAAPATVSPPVPVAPSPEAPPAPVVEDVVVEEPAEEPAEEPVAEPVALVLTEVPAEEEAAAEPEPPPAAPALTGTWSGVANDKPLTIQVTSQEGERLVGKLTFTQGATERVASFSGSVAAGSNRVTLTEEGGAGLTFTGVVRGTGMMGTYGRNGKDPALSWSARKQ